MLQYFSKDFWTGIECILMSKEHLEKSLWSYRKTRSASLMHGILKLYTKNTQRRGKEKNVQQFYPQKWELTQTTSGLAVRVCILKLLHQRGIVTTPGAWRTITEKRPTACSFVSAEILSGLNLQVDYLKLNIVETFRQQERFQQWSQLTWAWVGSVLLEVFKQMLDSHLLGMLVFLAISRGLD